MAAHSTLRRVWIVRLARVDPLSVYEPGAGIHLVHTPEQPCVAAAHPGLALVRARIHQAQGSCLLLSTYPVLVDLGCGRVPVHVDRPDLKRKGERGLDLGER